MRMSIEELDGSFDEGSTGGHLGMELPIIDHIAALAAAPSDAGEEGAGDGGWVFNGPHVYGAPWAPKLTLAIPRSSSRADPQRRKPKVCASIPKTQYSLNGAASSMQEIVLQKYIDVAAFVSATLIVRVHALSVGSGQRFHIVTQYTSRADDELETVFWTSSNETTVTLDVSTAAPSAFVEGVRAPLPAQVRLLLRALQHSTPSAMSCTLSIEIQGFER